MNVEQEIEKETAEIQSIALELKFGLITADDVYALSKPHLKRLKKLNHEKYKAVEGNQIHSIKH